MTAKVEIYASPFCGYCARAKGLLSRKGVDYVEYDILAQPDLRDEMIGRAGGRTSVPQIFVDGKHVGGCDDIHALDAQGKLDPLLAG
ncbi:MAG: glutaredoxin 3 [Tagaea sp.]|nr:glutaredoxin 3 [Azospirillum sp.]MCA3267454.1 glutaredoxin 3 [Azospirillum sp.]MCZ8124555.1 glutaredoxin 3 [Magnetospirillum sp.]